MTDAVLNSEGIRIRVADEVWIATALLHKEKPDKRDFTVHQIVERAARENIGGSLRPGVKIHAYLHCVANKAPNPARYRMLFATGDSTRRLYRPSDSVHPERKGKIIPKRAQIPERYRELLDWYEREYCSRREEPVKAGPSEDTFESLWGLGSEIWRDQDPDEYVRKLREGWD